MGLIFPASPKMNTSTTLRFYNYSLAMKEPVPVGGAMMSTRRGILVRAKDGDGNMGWGEAAPLDGFGTETIDGAVEAVRSGQVTPSLEFAVDCARRGMVAAKNGISFASSLGEMKRSCLKNVRLNPTESVRAGVSVKFKVGRNSVREDSDRLLNWMELNPESTVRLDANGLWRREDAVLFADHVGARRERIEFIEEPWNGCFEVDNRADYPFRLAIDESLDSENWAHADMVILKPSLLGAIQDVMSWARMIQDSGRSVVWSSAYESGVGMTVLVGIASRFDGPAVGFGTYGYLQGDVGGKIASLEGDSICVADLPVLPGAHIDMRRLSEIHLT
jgi:O-succinylbenzoate synthase